MNIKKMKENATIPTYATKYSAGADLYACIEESIIIKPFETKMIHTGICMEIPDGLVGLIYARSGMAFKKGLAPANKVGVIDSDYRGEIMVAMYNQSDKEVVIEDKDRIAQIVFTPYVMQEFNEVENLSDTVRGDSGYGSTGR